MSDDSKLSASKQALLAKWLQGKVKTQSSIPRRPADVQAALSFAQQRLWFLDQYEPGSPFYNMPMALRLTGTLATDALNRTLNELVRRHATLRTVFALDGDMPVQRDTGKAELTVPLHDLTHLAVAQRETKAQELAQAEALAPFDLGTGPLIRATLLRLDDQQHILLFTLHHIVADGWSLGVLVDEVAALYGAFVQGQASPLSELPIQYTDFAHWQRTSLDGAALQKQVDYWKAQLEEATPLLILPTDHARPARQSHRGAVLHFTVDGVTGQALQALVQPGGSTLFMALLAAFNVLLARYSGQTDICIGTPVANRSRPELEKLIGFFANTLVLRTQVNEYASFNELLADTRRTALDSYAHQDVPFEQLVEVLKPERNAGHSPLFQVMLALQNTPAGTLELPGLQLDPVLTERVTAKFDLMLNVAEEADGSLACALEYSTDLFQAATIQRMACHFARLLDAIVAAPSAPIHTLVMLDTREQLAQLEQGGRTAAPLAVEPVHRMFEAQALRTPDRIALEFGPVTLSYAQLNRRSDILSQRLRSQGVGPDVCVGVCTNRSPEMVIGVLAILKAGGAYVALDPNYPQERLAYMLSDAAPRLVLTQRALLERLPATPYLLLDDAAEDGEAAAISTVTGPDMANLAYVIYTSGSTGRPKGVGLSHTALSNLIAWQLAEHPVTGGRVLQFASLNFDVSFQEIFSTLCGGDTLVLLDEAQRQDMEHLQHLVLNGGFRRVFLPNAVLQQFAGLPLPDAAKGHCDIITAGEQLLAGPAVKALMRAAGGNLFNQYGPSETHVATQFRLDARDMDDWPTQPPIGRAIANTRIYILDAYFNPVASGAVGELYIAGMCLGRAYINQPALTAAAFLPDPYGAQPGARMYRTGDLARRRADGNIEYLGRIDGQVKIRGMRVELGEIEAALRALAGVREASAQAREDTPGDKRLVAYVAMDADAFRPQDMRAALSGGLPEHMLPAHIVRLSQLPLTRNGKVDRRALPAPEGSRGEDDYETPAGPLESTVAAVWADVLKLDKVGRNDNFFHLGGHSLLATLVMTRLRRALRRDIALRTLFEAPTVRLLAASIAQQPDIEDSHIPVASRDVALPLSFAQQRLWFLDQLETSSAFYNIPFALRVHGRLDTAALQRTLSHVLERHEVLRTRFVTEAGTPVQRISTVAELALPVVSLVHLPHAEREAQVTWRAQVEAQTPFDLMQAPLLRASLLQLAEDEHILLLTMHHIASDGWSVGVLVREVAALYSAFAQGHAAPLAPLAHQYADYACWQRERLAGDRMQRQLDYWLKQLADAPTLLTLPTDRPRPAVQTYAGASHVFTVDSSVTSVLRDIGARQGATLFMTLAAAYHILLARYAGQSDICTGSPVAGREHAELSDLIGFFVNTVVLRSRLDLHLPFAALLEQMRQVALDAFANQDVPFEQLVERLAPERDASHAPLFQAMFVLQNAPIGELELPGLRLSPVTTGTVSAKFDLTLSVSEDEGGLWCALEYNTDLFEASTIENMAGHYARLLQALTEAQDTPIGDLPLMDGIERARTLRVPSASHIESLCLHQLFEQQAARSPSGIALVCEDQRLSYAELNARANRVAHQLRAMGVGPDVLVGLAVERKPEMIVGLLAILKAGGAYVPLDPSYPEDRIAYMLADAKPAVVLAQPHTAPACDAPVLCFDDEALSAQPDGNLANLTTPSNLAYVIYTSGSTGRPKGALLQHGNVTRLFKATAQWFDFSDKDSWSLFHSYAFDFSVWEIWGALLYGGKLVMVPYLVSRAPEQFHALLAAEQVTILNQTPSAFQQLMEADRQPGAPALSLRRVVFGGEALNQSALAPWFIRHGRTQPLLVNMYGITETTVHVTHVPLHAEIASASPIGVPIPDLGVYILDSRQNPAPVGVPGELHVSGAGLARGYLNRPDLTAERFVPDPFSAQAGSRMYRSGDLARWLPDGGIEYLGRIDNQIKIRGFRIELGEIESALAALDGVREALVLAREDNRGDKRLVAYVVSSLEEPALRAGLGKTLPEYMVPSHFVSLERFPLTANGKVDRKALPAPDLSRSQASYVAPSGEVEIGVAAIWAEVLMVERVGLHDNFFSLGGHSLLAAQLVARVRDAFSCELPLRSLFESPTVAGMVQRMAVAKAGAPSVAAITAVDRNGVLPLSFGQKRFWFLDQYQPGSAAYSAPIALSLKGIVDPDILQRTFNHLVARHEPLRTVFTAEDGEPRQLILPPFAPVIDTRDLSVLSEIERDHQIKDAIRNEAVTPFNLRHGPLLRIALLKLHEQEHVLLLTLHHILYDGWSMGVLLDEFTTLYCALREGASPALAPLPVQYADYTHWENVQLSGTSLDSQLDFWRAQLADAPALLALPVDRARPSVMTHNGATLHTVISVETTHGLLRLGQSRQATLFMVLAAAFNTLMHRYTGQDDLCIGALSANRPAGTTGLIGIFVNILALRSRASIDEPFTAVLQRTRDSLLAAYENPLPFELVLSHIAPQRDASSLPYAQVALNFHNERDPKVDDTAFARSRAGGLHIAGLHGSSATHAHFELKLEMGLEGDVLHIDYEYNTDLFDASTIESMAGHYARILQALTEAPDTPIGDLPLMDDSARALTLRVPSASHTESLCLHQLFEQQAARCPDAIALVCEDQRLSYAELNARANRVAHRLRAMGVGPDVLVGLSVERKPEMIVGLLAILKAGGAYVPLDPSYPEDRIAYMLADAKPAVVLAQPHTAPACDAPVLCFDDEALSSQPDSNLANLTTPSNLAYVIYTSGSTGRPKGALLQHGNVTRLFKATAQWFDFSDKDSWSLFHSYAFDFSVWEIWGALLYGGKLVMVPYLVSRAPEQFHALLAAEQVTILNQTPSAFQQLMEADRQPGAPALSLRQVVFGGEALNQSALAPWFIRHGRTQPLLVNMYGITETTVHVTHVPLHAEIASASPIGVPIPDLGVYILDSRQNPVPVGVPGELHVSGAGLARGYLNRPDLTAERFVPDPFSAQAGARMYRSGDLARWLPDGGIEYLGRIDHQIKIRGFRIELGEIESALAALDGVREALVLAREDNRGDKRLVAYVVSSLEESALRAGLGKTLPEYMVPSHFVSLERFPLTGNGKVDRKALPAPDLSRSQADYVAPSGEVEIAVAAIWAEVLMVERVGLHDNFFSLGGHSLLATQVISRTRTRFNVNLPLRSLFESPTVGAIAALIGETEQDSAAEHIPQADRNQALPLSYAQQRLWVLDQFTAGTASYNVPFVLTLRGQLDVKALQRTLNEVVRRHEALRTTFHAEDGIPVQRVTASVTLPLVQTDLSDLPRSEREAHAAWMAQDMAQAPFDLATGPLIRASIVRMGESEHRFMLTMHHIVSDGWSVGVLVGELAALYSAYTQGLPSPLAPLSIQYADFAQWQRNWLIGPVLDAQRSYWRDYLSGAPAILTLPTDRPRPPVQTYRGAVHYFHLPASVATGLQALGRETGTTLFMSLAAAFNIVLSRYSGQDDICLGTSIANRNRADIEPLIGFFVNTLVLRTRIDRSMRFRTLLEGVRADSLAAYARQDLPFEYLVDDLHLERQRSHSPLFQVMLVVQNAPLGDLELAGLELEPLRAETASAKFDLTLGVGGEGDTLSASMEYSTDLFDESTIVRMAQHFTRLLESIVAAPDARIGDLDMLTPAERQLVLYGWNDSATRHTSGLPIHRQIEAQVARTPERTAVLCRGIRLSYSQLNARANRLAHRLHSHGVAPDTLVGVCMERSLEMVVAVLAVLKAGAAYVPLDPGYPEQRLSYMLDDARPAVLLTQSHLPIARQALGVPVAFLDREDDAAYPDTNLPLQAVAQNLAYVIYTSGSTGKPKGTAVHQGGLLNLVNWFVKQFGIGAEDKILLFSSFSFDLTQKNLYAALISGGELHLPAEGYDPQGAATLIREQGITCINCAPSAFYPLLAHGPLPLRHVFLGGEPIRAELLLESFSHRTKVPAIHNTYGPTEASDVVSFHSWDMAQGSTVIPIGRPIANTQLYILDQDMQPVPPGAAGELHIGGDGVGRGYRQRPALTAEKFVPDPFGTSAGARLYKTGDLARFLPDGAIEYLGRIDHQIKLRGFRIELGEIEAELGAIAGIGEMLVMLREDTPGDRRLVAYLCGPAVPDAPMLRATLLRSLPDYMVPAHFVVLEKMPLSPNGKIERRELPVPDAVSFVQEYVAPSTPVEKTIAAIWASVLKVGRIGVQDNFFELGGHSLMAVQVLSRITRETGVTLPIETIFAAQTVALLARELETRRPAPQDGVTTIRI
ncbi:amino acid adenylation domain-containing protein [Duganella sacchari]|uniref:Amino acid adenylation domain-containing protein n=1 Tax=Duganella sacchari TaxID=551987 RepID=A0A1M7LL67_9BURK|nr:non-ribosomal peptide synthetase [Duganella sacchari]SHM78877.1 amino acid adenylation domain-containing protein [Duganella sacchari]